MPERSELEALLAEIESINTVLNQRKKQNGLQYYIPNTHQRSVHKSKGRLILLCGGNRVGKSTCGAVEIAMHLSKKYPDWYPFEKRYRGPVKCVVVCEENQFIEKYAKLVELIMETAWKEQNEK